MRIRKRPPLCSSAPTPPPLSDLHLRRSEAAPPSEQTKRWGFPWYEEKMKQKEFGDDEGVMNSNNDIRKIVSICHGEDGFNANNMLHPSSSSSPLQAEEDYKLVPLKKRKGNFERSTNEESKISAKMKSKTNKKYNSDVVALDPKAAVKEDGSGSGGSEKNRKKKNKRGNVIMEGSRCSRVNGRGWRCCQPTLVGYSLCEHHLGKGRLRIAQPPPLPPPPSKKRRSKVGVVKARSMSSLLSQI